MNKWLIVLLLLYSELAVADAWFETHEQQGRWAFYQKKYHQSAEYFQQPYRQGVALYRAQRYADAVASFKKNNNAQLHIPATYNLGNAYFQMAQYALAIQSYVTVLAQTEHANARYNLNLARQLLALQKKEKPPITNESNESNESNENDSKSDNKSNSANARDNKEKDNHTENTSQKIEKTDTDKQATQTSPEIEQGTDADVNQEENIPDESSPQQQVSEKIKDFAPDNSEALSTFDQQQIQSISTINNITLLSQFSEQQINHLLNQVEAEPQRLLKNQFRLEALRQKKHLIEERPW